MSVEDEFRQAIEIQREESRMQVRERIGKLWSLIGPIAVWCPSCSKTQKVQTTKAVICFHCGCKYKVYPKNGKSRVVWVPEGRLSLLHEIRSLQTTGGYTNIL